MLTKGLTSHWSNALGGIQASIMVPPQLDSMRPNGQSNGKCKLRKRIGSFERFHECPLGCFKCDTLSKKKLQCQYNSFQGIYKPYPKEFFSQDKSRRSPHLVKNRSPRGLYLSQKPIFQLAQICARLIFSCLLYKILEYLTEKLKIVPQWTQISKLRNSDNLSKLR